jgi:hypothetical protein
MRGRAAIEIAFVAFLFLYFYANLLMAELERSGMGRKPGIVQAIPDVLTTASFEIAMIAAVIGICVL